VHRLRDGRSRPAHELHPRLRCGREERARVKSKLSSHIFDPCFLKEQVVLECTSCTCTQVLR
jgi:hypothetical protein